MNRFLDRKNKQHNANSHGSRSEEQTMKKLGARLQVASGRLQTAKSDGFDISFQYENKSTLSKSYPLKLEILHKIKKEARDANRQPVLVVCFVTETGQPVKDGEYAIISLDLFNEMKTLCMGKML